MYSITFDEKAVDFLDSLERKLKQRIFDKITSSKIQPHSFFIGLKGRKDYKLRIGDYRAIADIDDNKMTIHITLIDHRKNIYKKMR